MGVVRLATACVNHADGQIDPLSDEGTGEAGGPGQTVRLSAPSAQRCRSGVGKHVVTRAYLHQYGVAILRCGGYAER